MALYYSGKRGGAYGRYDSRRGSKDSNQSDVSESSVSTRYDSRRGSKDSCRSDVSDLSVSIRYESRRDSYKSNVSDQSVDSGWSENSSAKGATKSVRFSLPAEPTISSLERKLSGMQEDFDQQLQSMTEKGMEKFDLVFAILTDLQSGQAQLEESIQEIKKLAAAGQTAGVPAAMPPPSQQFSDGQPPQQFSAGGGFQQPGQAGGVMLGGQMSAQQPICPPVVMQTDGSQAMMMVAVPQPMVMQPPAGVMLAPQMMAAGGQMQPMHPQMAMHFVGHSPVAQDVACCFQPGMEQDAGLKSSLRLSDVSKTFEVESDSTDTPRTMSAFSD